MKKQLVGIVVAIGLLGLATQAILPALAAAQTARPASEALLDATVQITLYAPLGENSREKLYATGLGTLVRAGGENLIITHDHWGTVLEGVSKAEFASADHRPLVELDGAAFRALIRHRDGGTMVLQAPEILVVTRPWAPRLKPVTAGDGEGIQVGDTVTVAYRLPATGRESVSTFEALVQPMEIKDGQPAWRLQSAQGERVIPDDSGGGIWKDGELVGNLWACVVETVYSSVAPDGEDVATDRSVAAVLGADDWSDSVPAEHPATTQSGRSISGDSRVPGRGGLRRHFGLRVVVRTLDQLDPAAGQLGENRGLGGRVGKVSVLGAHEDQRWQVDLPEGLLGGLAGRVRQAHDGRVRAGPRDGSCKDHRITVGVHHGDHSLLVDELIGALQQRTEVNPAPDATDCRSLKRMAQVAGHGQVSTSGVENQPPVRRRSKCNSLVGTAGAW